MTDGLGLSLPAGAVPHFEVRIARPDLSPWREGNIGIPGFMSFRGAEIGPHVALIALVHGNEIAGAIVLDRLLREGLRPLRGRLTIGFANLAAFDRFDPSQPTASRFVDEDLNRIWDRDVLDGPRVSLELMRGRQIRRVIDQADIVIDLHSMLWPSDPLILCGATERGRRLACEIGTPGLVVADHGHAGGLRLIDYAPFSEADGRRSACLIEAGQHWEPGTVETSEAAVRAMLRTHGMIAAQAGAAPLPPAPGRPRCAEVTEAITAATSRFAFTSEYRGGDVIGPVGTLIAHDGDAEIRTPYADCLMVMPNLRPTRGHTAVRLARLIEA